MKIFYFFIMLSVVLGNSVQAQNTILEQQIIDSLKVQSNEPVFTDKQLLYINEMALGRSEASTDRALDLFSKTIDTIALFFTLFSIGIAIVAFLGINELKKIKDFRKEQETVINNELSEIRSKYEAVKNEIKDQNSSLSKAIQTKNRIDYIRLKIVENDFKSAFTLIEESKRIYNNDEFISSQLKLLEAKVRCSSDEDSFYDLNLSEKLLLDLTEINKNFELLDLIGWINFQHWEQSKNNEYITKAISYFENILSLEIEPIEKKQTFANIATGYKRLGEFELALENIKQAEDVKDFTNEKLNKYISKFKSQIEHNL